MTPIQFLKRLKLLFERKMSRKYIFGIKLYAFFFYYYFKMLLNYKNKSIALYFIPTTTTKLIITNTKL